MDKLSTFFSVVKGLRLVFVINKETRTLEASILLNAVSKIHVNLENICHIYVIHRQTIKVDRCT